MVSRCKCYYSKCNFFREYLKSGWCQEEFSLAHVELVKGQNKLIIFVMVDDIQVEELPDVMQAFVKTRTYIDAVNIKNQKDLDLFRKKLQYSMPQTALKDVPKPDANPAGRNPNFPPQFNRLNNYREYNIRMGRNPKKEQEQGHVEEMEGEAEIIVLTGDCSLTSSKNSMLSTTTETI